jgi:hypothetical protein
MAYCPHAGGTVKNIQVFCLDGLDDLSGYVKPCFDYSLPVQALHAKVARSAKAPLPPLGARGEASTATNLSHTLAPCPMLSAMNPSSAFTMLIATAQSLVAAVNTRDDLHLRPAVARKAVAARLVSGLAVLRAFLRRLILLIALDLEWSLVDTRGAMKRPHGRKVKKSTKLNLRILDADKPSPWLGGNCPKFAIQNNYAQGQKDGYNPPVYVDMAKLYAQLNYLSGIATNPHAKAKRLAFHLARTREGIIMAPEGPDRIAGRWGTEVNAHFYAMAGSIMTKSRNRPPPLPPPRTHWPTITAL